MSKHPDNIIKIAETLLETNKKHCQEINELRKELSDQQEKIKLLKGTLERLGDDLDTLDIQKNILIVKNNNMRGLLSKSIVCINSLRCFAKNKELITEIEKIIDDICEALK